MLAVSVQPWLKQELQKMLCIIQNKIKQNENGRQSFLDCSRQWRALQLKFHNVTLVCDNSLTILNYKVILVTINTVSGGLLWKPPDPYPLVYIRGVGEDQYLVQGAEGTEDRTKKMKKDKL